MTDERISIVIDDDCPGCGWPECRAIGTMESGPQRVECARREPCGWSRTIVQRRRVRPVGTRP